MRKPSKLLACIVLLVIYPQGANASDKPSELIIGKWRDRAEPNDAVIEFAKDGTGTITDVTAERTNQAKISWKISQIFGHACILNIKYELPTPKKIKPILWLVAFDGKDTYVIQPKQNKIVFMDRQKKAQ